MQLHRARSEFEQAGVRLALVGMGSPEQAAAFRASQRIELPILTDPKRDAYREAGTKVATFSELLGPRVVARGIWRGIAARVHQGRTVGHPAQLGGVAIVMPDGSVPYAHMAEDASDNAPVAEIVAAARRVIP